jgi:aminoglycoside phosphotransferase (APT) family kinase protein
VRTTGRRAAPADILAGLRAARSLERNAQNQALDALGLRPLTGGRNNHIYAWNNPDGPACIKLYRLDDRRRPEREWHALSLLAARHVRHVPRPLWLHDSADFPAIAMSFIAGTPIPETAHKEAALSGLIKTWQQIHAIPVDGPLSAMVRIDSAAHYCNRITGIWAGQLADTPDDPLTGELQSLLDNWQQSGDGEVLAEPRPPAFSHGDANLLNWLHDPDTRATSCVDFEFSGTSDPAFDIADLVEHISSRIFSDETWAAVAAALGDADATFARRFLAAQRTCAMRWLAVLWKQRHARTEEFSTQLDRVRMLQRAAKRHPNVVPVRQPGRVCTG